MSADGDFAAGSTTSSGRWPARSSQRRRVEPPVVLHRLLARINAYLVRWIRNKYRRYDKTRAAHRKFAQITSGYPTSSGTGAGSRPPGEQGYKSPVAGDCHAGICGSRRAKLPPATRPWPDGRAR